MGAFQVWKRLLWKEYREGRLVVLLAALAPYVLFGLAANYPVSSMQRTILVLSGAAGVHLAIAFWGAGRGGSKRTGSEFAWTHLPMNPTVEWLASMVVPTVVIAGMGAWYGLAATSGAHGYHHGMSIPLAGMLDLATTFAICYMISMVVSNSAAYVVGFSRLIGGTLISVWDLNMIITPDTVQMAARTLLGAMLGAFVYVVLLRKRSVAMRQGLSLGIVVLVALGPLVPQISVGRAISAWMASRQASNELCDYEQSSDDGTVTVSLANPPTKAGAYLLMRDYRRGITRKRLFPACWVFRVQPDGRAYLARAKSNAVEIVEWNGVNNEVTTVATTPVKGRYFAGDGWNCSVSPDGNYMALLLKSMLHDNATDLWLIDMGRGTCKLALPNADGYRQQHLEWPKGEVALWEELSGATAVNIETLAVRRITLNEEGKR